GVDALERAHDLPDDRGLLGARIPYQSAPQSGCFVPYAVALDAELDAIGDGRGAYKQCADGEAGGICAPVGAPPEGKILDHGRQQSVGYARWIERAPQVYRNDWGWDGPDRLVLCLRVIRRLFLRFVLLALRRMLSNPTVAHVRDDDLLLPWVDRQP